MLAEEYGISIKLSSLILDYSNEEDDEGDILYDLFMTLGGITSTKEISPIDCLLEDGNYKLLNELEQQ